MKRIVFVLCGIIAAVSCAASASDIKIAEGFSDNIQVRPLCVVSGVFREGGTKEHVVLFGKPFEDGSPYFVDIFLCIGDTCFAPTENSGYSPCIAAFDFLGKGYEQIFYSASTGGSGGFGNYYVYDLSEGVETLFDAAEVRNPFSARFRDGKLIEVSEDGKPFVLFDVSESVYSDALWDESGNYIGEGEASVSDVNYVEPVYEPFEKRFRLMLWYKVTGCCMADTAGYIVRRIDIADENAVIFSAAESDFALSKTG